MQRLLIFLFLLIPTGGLFAQAPAAPAHLVSTAPPMSTDPTSREGLYAGVSLGWSHYKTSWYYYRTDGNPRHDNYPVHSIDRLVLALDLEKKSLWKTQHLHFDLGGELGIGVAGKAKGLWLPDDDVISSGGMSVVVNAFVRAVYVPEDHGQGSGAHIYPFVSLGPQFHFLYNNGKGTGPYASKSYYSYTDGWSEYLTLLGASFGVDIQIDNMVLTPELRLGLFGGATTNWEPNQGGVNKDGGPAFTGFSLRLSRRL